MIYPAPQSVPEVEIVAPFIETAGVRLIVRREDMNHSEISGNKYWKLKHNLLEAARLGHNTVLTFGGAFSNHIAATAAACKITGLTGIGIIRGEDADMNNPTLARAQEDGMLLQRITRSLYKEKMSIEFLQKMRDLFGKFYLIPEGGTNYFAIKGAAEMTSQIKTKFDYLALPVGTGGTVTGCIQHQKGRAQILGLSTLKGGFLVKEITEIHQKNELDSFSNWHIVEDYHFGGYGKLTPELGAFIRDFEQMFAIPLDPVYTGKMMFGLFNMISKGDFPKGSVVYAIHTGGLQGRAGFGDRLA